MWIGFVFICFGYIYMAVWINKLHKRINTLEEETLKTGFAMNTVAANIKNFVSISEAINKSYATLKTQVDKDYTEYSEFRKATADFALAITDQLTALAKGRSSISDFGLNKTDKTKPN